MVDLSKKADEYVVDLSKKGNEYVVDLSKKADEYAVDLSKKADEHAADLNKKADEYMADLGKKSNNEDPPHKLITFDEGGFRKKYFSFQGRLNRKRYWYRLIMAYFVLHASSILLEIFDLHLQSVILVLVAAYMFVCISLGVRRMHDVNKSGWYLLIPFYSLYLCLIKGTSGDNRFGPDPLGNMNR